MKTGISEFCGLYAKKSAFAYVFVLLSYQIYKSISEQSAWGLPVMFTIALIMHLYFTTKVNAELRPDPKQLSVAN